MKKEALFALALLASPLMASAAGDLDGAYAGIYYGGVKGSDNGIEYWSPPPFADGYTQQTKPSGNATGLTAGYSWLIEEHLLLGIEANYERRSVRDTSPQQLFYVPDTTRRFKTESEAARSLLAKVGFTINERRTAVYTTAGYIWASMRRTLTSTVAGASETESKWLGGWTAGLGMEHLLIDHLSVMADYRFSQYEDKSFYLNNVIIGYEDQTYDEHQFRIGVSYRF